MRIVVTGLIATYPLGGVGWDYLAYVSGFRRLGHEVFYLEDTGQWLYDPRIGSFTDEVSFNAAYLEATLARAGEEMRERWALRAPDGTYHGSALREVERCLLRRRSLPERLGRLLAAGGVPRRAPHRLPRQRSRVTARRSFSRSSKALRPRTRRIRWA